MSKYTSFKFWIKPLLILGGIAVLLGAAWVIFGRGCGDQPQPSASQGGGVPPGWAKPPTQTTPWFPFQHNAASEATAVFPPGSHVVEVQVPPGAETIQVGILPGGEVVVPQGTVAILYEKRASIFDVHPMVGGGATYAADGIGAAAVCNVGLLKLGPVRGCVGLAVDTRPAVAVFAGPSVDVFGNVAAFAGGGYGTGGAIVVAGVTVGLK